MTHASFASSLASEQGIQEMLGELEQIGNDGTGAISRVCFTPEEDKGHALVASWMRDIGLDVTRDGFGNTVGVLRGIGDTGRSIALGSHIDSVPQGGNYDGAVGVVGALEAVRSISTSGVGLNQDLKVTCFTAEEGARFGTPCLGSKAALGLLTEEDVERLSDPHGVTLADVLEERGGSTAVAEPAPWTVGVEAFIELHIEQGRVLEDSRQEIGIVDWIAGNRRLRLGFRGTTDHSGATPMPLRRDALVAAAGVVTDVDRLARKRRGLVGTVGEFSVSPGAMTAVAGSVDMSIDVRSADVMIQEDTIQRAQESAWTRASEQGVALEVSDVSDVAPIMLPAWLRRILTDVARAVTETPRVMTSGAGHDAAIVARKIPAGMVFVPCRGGISHSPEEWASPRHIALGTDVLINAVLQLDQTLSDSADGP